MASAAPTENTSLVVVGPQSNSRAGRPETYTDELAHEICERIAAGETLTAICNEEDMPNIRTVSRWLMRKPDFAQIYAHAREAQADIESEQIREIADNAYEDYYIDWKQNADGTRTPFVVVNNESVKRAQLRIATRQWRMERLNRRRYASSVKHEVEVSTADALGPGGLPPSLTFLDKRSGENGD